MPDKPVPSDLIKLTDVLRDYRPKRGWWEQRIEKGEIEPYYVPGERGIWFSRADVDRLTAPRHYDRSRDDAESAG